MDGKTKIALGGGCHWCTEAVFQSLKGVEKVEQGYVASIGKYASFSEAVIVHFNSENISLKTLVEIHLHTHKSSVNHSMREKYRSAIYCFSKTQEEKANEILMELQKDFSKKIITKVYSFNVFRASREAIQNYYKKNPEKPFCEKFINPKLTILKQKFATHSLI
ncbi:MAG: peptide methionine sulfoxide reductase [Bacteroidetes bacterium]|nr:MAG: peptide methionine sulfoxide reductase [Bacteroidota bacterium]